MPGNDAPAQEPSLRMKEDANGRIHWSLVDAAGVVVKDGYELKPILAEAQKRFGRVTLSCWNVTKGQAESEFLADPYW